MKRLLIILTIVIAQAIPATAESREKNLEQWLESDLTPYVKQQLLTHPRFKNETVMFVVLHDNAPASTSNELALSLRDRLLEASIDSKGVSIGWQQGRSGTALESRPDDCLHDKVHYYIGIELTQQLDSRYSVSVRALDLEDRTWVTGFGRQWQGRLSTIERQAMRQYSVDETFLGAREVPFTEAQTDLIASNLAHQLSCSLKQHLEDEYVVANQLSDSDAQALAGTVELIGNNLASSQALRLTAKPDLANATLSAKAHPIDGELYQYWLTVTPAEGFEHLDAMSVSTYVLIPNAQPRQARSPQQNAAISTDVGYTRAERPAATTKLMPVSIPSAGADALIAPLRIARPNNGSDCEWPCSLLQTRTNTDAILFFLEHQSNHGLVRLSDSDCRRRTAAKVARKNDLINFPIARTSSDRKDWTETFDWQMTDGADTYYAIVATNSESARAIANHIDELPQRCSSSLRPGLQGAALQAWLQEFAAIAAKSSRHIDWRAVAVRDIT